MDANIVSDRDFSSDNDSSFEDIDHHQCSDDGDSSEGDCLLVTLPPDVAAAAAASKATTQPNASKITSSSIGGASSFTASIVEAAPSEVSSKTTTASNDPVKLQLFQQQLVLLLHAHKCRQKARDAAPSPYSCKVPLCATMGEVLMHMTTCNDGKQCKYEHCASSRQVIYHWRNCHRDDCPVCRPLRKLYGPAVAGASAAVGTKKDANEAQLQPQLNAVDAALQALQQPITLSPTQVDESTQAQEIMDYLRLKLPKLEQQMQVQDEKLQRLLQQQPAAFNGEMLRKKRCRQEDEKSEHAKRSKKCNTAKDLLEKAFDQIRGIFEESEIQTSDKDDQPCMEYVRKGLSNVSRLLARGETSKLKGFVDVLSKGNASDSKITRAMNMCGDDEDEEMDKMIPFLPTSQRKLRIPTSMEVNDRRMRELLGESVLAAIAAPKMTSISRWSPDSSCHLFSSMRSPDPVEADQMQQQLIMLLHAQKCLQEEDADPCTVRHCASTIELLIHITKCRNGRGCNYAHCPSSRQLIEHWQRCRQEQCTMCAPLVQEYPKKDGTMDIFDDILSLLQSFDPPLVQQMKHHQQEQARKSHEDALRFLESQRPNKYSETNPLEQQVMKTAEAASKSSRFPSMWSSDPKARDQMKQQLSSLADELKHLQEMSGDMLDVLMRKPEQQKTNDRTPREGRSQVVAKDDASKIIAQLQAQMEALKLEVESQNKKNEGMSGMKEMFEKKIAEMDKQHTSIIAQLQAQNGNLSDLRGIWSNNSDEYEKTIANLQESLAQAQKSIKEKDEEIVRLKMASETKE